MATTLSYSVADFQAFTKIVSADMNTKLNDIKSRLNWAGGTDATTGLGDDNLQSNAVSGGGLTRATKLKLGTADHVVVNSGTGAMSSEAQLATTRGGLGFNPTFASNTGKAVVVNSGETGFELGSPLQSTITQSLAGTIATFTAGEGISIRDAVCFDLHNGTGSNVYRVFKADYTQPKRRQSFAGIATAAATVTAGVYTYTASAAFVASNVIQTTINGRIYSTTYASSSDATLQAIATQIATDPDVASAVVTVIGGNQTGTDDREIVVTSRGGLSLTMSGVVTGGASQPTILVVNTVAPSGQNVIVQVFGPLSGFSGLTPGLYYYVGNSSGSITATPSDPNPVQVGQALSSSVLFINKNSLNFQFTTPTVFVRSHGNSAYSSPSNAVMDVETFNEISWSAGTDDSVATYSVGNGESTVASLHRVIDGISSGGSVTLVHRQYNKSAWSSGSNRTTPKQAFGGATIGSTFYAGKGSTDGSHTGATGVIDAFNGSSWTNGVDTITASVTPSTFFQGSKVHWVNGVDNTNTTQDLHESFNGTTSATETAIGVSTSAHSGISSTGSKGVAGLQNVGNDTYQWSGSSWSSAIPLTYAAASASNFNTGPGAGFISNTQNTYLNGGSTSSSNSITTTGKFQGVSWSTTTASTNGRAGPGGSAF